MPNIRIKDLPTTASATVAGDFFGVDSNVSTRKLNAFSPTFGGNLVVSGTGTINGTTIPASKTLVVTTDKLSALASTSSAELAGVISDETGTGALVFANSPTLVTPNLGTPSALVGTNITGTAAGLTAGNVTTNANLTGDVTSVGNATSIAAGVIVDADINASAAIADTKLATISTALKVSNSATTATSANTASAIVARDSSGNFSAGTITANLTGNVSGSSGSTTGNAATATALATGRTIAITGDLVYTSPSFDGTSNVTAAGTLATVATAGTTGSSTAIPIVTINAKGLTTSISTAAVIAPAGTLTGNTLASGVTASSLTSLGTIANLTATAGTIATTPTGSTDIANKLYVDTVAQGLDAKASCVAATTADITLSGAQTIDGVSVVAGNRVLVKNQSLSQNNGIYVCASGAWTRATDADTWDKLTSAFTFIEQGTVNADCGFVCTANTGGTLGTTALPWSQFSGAGTFTAGTGLTLTGSVFSLTSPVAVANGGTGLTSLGAGITTFLGTPSSANLASAVSDETGTGALVFANTPTLVTPILGTPQSGTLTNCTGLPVSTGVSGLGTNVATALATNVGTAGSVVVNGGALGTPSSGTLTNATGLPIATGVSGLGTNVATFLATPSSANLAAAVSDETGTGALVFANTPTLVTPNIGAATGTSFNLSGSGTLGTTLVVNGTTDSSSKDTGAIVTEGGLGVEKSATIGGNGAIAGTLTLGAITTPRGKLDSQQTYNGSAPSTSATPIIRANNGGAISLWTCGQGYDAMWLQAIQDDGANLSKSLLINPLGSNVELGSTSSQVLVKGTTASSSTSTGALVVSGGVGVAGAIYAGGKVVVNGGDASAAQFAVASASGTLVANLTAGSTTNQSFGLRMFAGTSASDYGLFLRNVTDTTTLFKVDGVGGTTVGGTLTVNGTSASAIGGNLSINGNVGTIGRAGSGTGGNWRFVSDDGASRWLTGILGGAGETSFSLYDLVNSRSLLTVTAAGVVQVPQTTASTSTSTGALVVSGGVGVAGAINAGGTLTVNGKIRNDPNTSISGDVAGGISNLSATGYGLRVQGGASGSGYIFSANDYTGSEKFQIAGSGNATFAGNTNTFGAGGTGGANSQLILEGGSAANGGGAILYRKNGTVKAYAGMQSSILGGGSTSDNYIIYTSTGLALTVAGQQVQANATTASTSTSTGALVVGGGVGVAGAAYVGGNATVFGTAGITINNVNGLGNDSILTLAQSGVSNAFIKNTATTGDIAIGDGGGTYLRITKGVGVVSLLNTSASTSTSSGALVVSGGVGVAKEVYVGKTCKVGTGSDNEGYTNVFTNKAENTAGPFDITLPSDCVGVVFLNSYQSGVGRSFREIPFICFGGTVTLGTSRTTVLTADPVTSVAAAASSKITISLYAGNTNCYWGIYVNKS